MSPKGFPLKISKPVMPGSGFKEQFCVVCKTVRRGQKCRLFNSRAVVKEQVLNIFRVNDVRIFVMLMRSSIE
jgi:hypothetical protein